MAVDAGEFDVLFQDFYPKLCLFISRVGTRDDIVEDIATDAFVALWDRWHAVSTLDDARKFLYRAARNAALNDLRNERARTRIVQRFPLDIEAAASGLRPEKTPDRTAHDTDVDRAVRATIASFPAVRRQVYTLRWEQGLHNAEIAELLELSLKTVEMHVTLAHKTLRETLASFRP